MPSIDDLYEMHDGFQNADREEIVSHESSKDSVSANGGLNRLEIRRAIEARREQRRLAKELDSIEFAMD